MCSRSSGLEDSTPSAEDSACHGGCSSSCDNLSGPPRPCCSQWKAQPLPNASSLRKVQPLPLRQHSDLEIVARLNGGIHVRNGLVTGIWESHRQQKLLTEISIHLVSGRTVGTALLPATDESSRVRYLSHKQPPFSPPRLNYIKFWYVVFRGKARRTSENLCYAQGFHESFVSWTLRFPSVGGHPALRASSSVTRLNVSARGWKRQSR